MYLYLAQCPTGTYIDVFRSYTEVHHQQEGGRVLHCLLWQRVFYGSVVRVELRRQKGLTNLCVLRWKRIPGIAALQIQIQSASQVHG